MTDKLRRILDTLYQMYPDAICELDFSTNEQLAIAVILSAQTTDISVNKVTPRLFEKYKTIEDLANGNEEDIMDCIHSIGLYRNKAKNIKLFAQQLIERHNGKLPNTEIELRALAGIGRKTANVILGVGYNIPALAVDTHVDRVSHRLGLVTIKANVLQTELQLKRKIPKEEWIVSHHSLLFFGRYHCLARNPKCDICPFTDICRYYKR
ncbi:MAG TPA: endonuclease III [Erysipelotrichaceae bacterium]|nr:endonuclease III [Erysipelotrichaceae bacterium]